MAYKADQGRYARLAAFWSLAILIFYGCTSLYTELTSRFASFKAPLAESFPRVPVVGVPVNLAMLVATVVLIGGMWLLQRFLEKPRWADLLIETEAELRKVTWPTWAEAARSSVVVIACVLFLMAFLAGSDWVIGRWADWLLLGG
jgi:preprotein translocase subunit SecE